MNIATLVPLLLTGALTGAVIGIGISLCQIGREHNRTQREIASRLKMISSWCEENWKR
jgi:hypothetical protein